METIIFTNSELIVNLLDFLMITDLSYKSVILYQRKSNTVDFLMILRRYNNQLYFDLIVLGFISKVKRFINLPFFNELSVYHSYRYMIILLKLIDCKQNYLLCLIFIKMYYEILHLKSKQHSFTYYINKYKDYSRKRCFDGLAVFSFDGLTVFNLDGLTAFSYFGAS
eukprot:GHVR01080961.1.p1 GENE.GHVR01080961.1~~GHVR01080961.1.p1  ORF type:complete len:167 (+),score=2.75 GHVR01080961.1:1011-1511(+)